MKTVFTKTAVIMLSLIILVFSSSYSCAAAVSEDAGEYEAGDFIYYPDDEEYPDWEQKRDALPSSVREEMNSKLAAMTESSAESEETDSSQTFPIAFIIPAAIIVFILAGVVTVLISRNKK